MSYKPLPIGIDNFEKLIEKGYYYVDKTLLIKNLLDSAAEVILFTRPRRFGKSLNLSMLQYFFEKSEKDRTHLFHGLKIEEKEELCGQHMGKYPVIMLNFKEAKRSTFALNYQCICRMIALEFERHNAILQWGVLSDVKMEEYELLQNRKADEESVINSIKFLSECLEKAYGKKVIILIDEYDVPLENAHFNKFYEEMVDFIRGMLSAALKTNTSLFMAVLTGCLRVSKESIFTGLNNLKIVSIENKIYGEYFGFTEDEVEEMLVYYRRQQCSDMVKNWYNGYLFGNTRVYNPWSLINYMDSLCVDENEIPRPYWSNTSSNSIVRELIERIDAVSKEELERLVAGGTIEKPIHEDITYADIYDNMNNLWNFLYFTGYLKKVSERLEKRDIYITMKIPNEEVAYIYEKHIKQWMDTRIEKMNFNILHQATLACNPEGMEDAIKQVLRGTISYYDTSNSADGESFFHGIMVGLYQGIQDYLVLSNRESGNGRPDLIIKAPSAEGKAYIIEFKIAQKFTELEKAAEKALIQVEEQEYRMGLLEEGYTDITVYGIGFFKKSCLVKMGK